MNVESEHDKSCKSNIGGNKKHDSSTTPTRDKKRQSLLNKSSTIEMSNKGPRLSNAVSIVTAANVSGDNRRSNVWSESRRTPEPILKKQSNMPS